MPRKRIIYTNEHPYHVTARTNNRTWFDVPMNYCFGIFTNVLEETILRYKVKLHSFVLMNNHFHMIMSTPKSNVGLALRYFMTETSRGIRVKSKRMNHIYGGRNYKSLIQAAPYYAHCMKYVYRNPVNAGVAEKVEEYSWSTISRVHRKIQDLVTEIDLGHNELLPLNRVERINWYNIKPSIALEEEIRRALQRTNFEFKTSQITKRRIDERSELYNV